MHYSDRLLEYELLGICCTNSFLIPGHKSTMSTKSPSGSCLVRRVPTGLICNLEVAYRRNSFDDPSLWCMQDRQQRSQAVGAAKKSLVIVRYSECPQFAARGRY